MKFSVFTASTPEWTPQETARILAAQGWDGIEWRVTDQEPSDPPGFWAGNRATWPLTGLEASLPEIARTTVDAGLEMSGIGGYVGASDRAGVERMLSATAVLGARQVRVTMPGTTGPADYRDLFARTRLDLEWAVERAAAYGVKVLVELHHRTIVTSASAAARLLDGLDPAYIGVIHDLGNLVIEGQEDALSGFQLLGDHLAHIHVKNVSWHPVREDPVEGTVWEERWATLRGGQASVPGYLDALAEIGYDGWVTLEDFSTELPLEERLADDLAYLRAVHAHVGAQRG